jgi:DNA-binding MarR family transcriptional regulator
MVSDRKRLIWLRGMVQTGDLEVSTIEKTTSRVLNEMLVKLFNNIMDAEEKAIITEEYKDITNNDMHIIEAIGIEEPRRMSDIAKRLNVTMGTLTTNMNSLEEKGYIIRERSKTDKRVVLVVLTPKGKKAFCHHRGFHRNMIKAIVRGLDEDEMKVMIKCLLNLNEFFEKYENGQFQ